MPTTADRGSPATGRRRMNRHSESAVSTGKGSDGYQGLALPVNRASQACGFGRKSRASPAGASNGLPHHGAGLDAGHDLRRPAEYSAGATHRILAIADHLEPAASRIPSLANHRDRQDTFHSPTKRVASLIRDSSSRLKRSDRTTNRGWPTSRPKDRLRIFQQLVSAGPRKCSQHAQRLRRPS